MPQKLFGGDLYFIPCVQDTKILESGLEFEYIMTDATTTQWRPNVLPTLLDAGKVIINPNTNKLIYENARKKTNFQKLPYCIDGAEINNLYSNPTFRLDNLVRPSVTYQNDSGASVIMTPYFYFDDQASQYFNLTVSSLSEAARVMQDNNIDKPLLGVICLSPRILTNNENLAYIRERFTDYADMVDAFVVSVDAVDDRLAEENVLYGLGQLVHQLSSFKPVVVMHVGGFGQVLLALGASAYSSGVSGGESLNLASYDSDGANRRPRGDNWIYVPELFNYLDEADMQGTSYRCKCAVCNSSLPTAREDKRKHFLIAKQKSASDLQPLSKTQRIDKMLGEISSAKDLARRLRNDHNVSPPHGTAYLERWENVLKEAKTWSDPAQDASELENLLGELDND